jgi:putative acetyltransferase
VPPTEPTLRRATDADGPAVRALVFGILRDYNLPTDAHTDEDLNDFDAHYFSRGGDFTVLTADGGRVIGCVGLFRAEPTTLELRKMYLDQAWRGRGLGRRLLEHALARARELGAKKITLETAQVLKEAIALYTRNGFRPSACGVHSCRCDLAMELELK